MSVKRINTIGALWLLAAFSFPGCTSKQTVSGRESNLYSDRQDDWSTASFWYEAVPSAPLPPLPGLALRIADIPEAAGN